MFKAANKWLCLNPKFFYDFKYVFDCDNISLHKY